MMSNKQEEGGWVFCDISTIGIGHRSVTDGEREKSVESKFA